MNCNGILMCKDLNDSVAQRADPSTLPGTDRQASSAREPSGITSGTAERSADPMGGAWIRTPEVCRTPWKRGPGRASRQEAGQRGACCCSRPRSLSQSFVISSSKCNKIFTMFAFNIAFFSIFQNLQDFTKICKKSAKFLQDFSIFCMFSENFQKILKNFAKFPRKFAQFCKFAREKMIFL